MATDTQTVSKIDTLMRDVYLPGHEIWRQFYQGSPTLDLLEQGRKLRGIAVHEGRRIYMPTCTGENPNVDVPVREEGGFPIPGAQDYKKLVYNASFLVTSLKLSGYLMDAADGGDRSFGNAMSHEMNGVALASRRRRNLRTYSDGSSQCGTLPATGAWTAATRKFVVAATDLPFIRVGMELQLYKLLSDTTGVDYDQPHASISDPDTPFIVQVKDDSTNPPTITVGTSPTNTLVNGLDADIADLSLYGLFMFKAQGFDIDGFKVICSDANPANKGRASAHLYAGVDRTVDTFFKAQVVDASATVSTRLSIETHIQELQRLCMNAAEEVPNLMFVNPINWNRILNDLRRMNTQDSSKKVLHQQYEAIGFNETLIVKDQDCPVTDAYAIHTDFVYRYNWKPHAWLQRDGRIWHRYTNARGRDTDTYRAYFGSRQQLIVPKCNVHGRVKNLAA